MGVASALYEKLGRAMAAVGFVVRSSSTSTVTSDPTITSGSGAPSATEPAASIYLRTSNGAWYRRVGSSWELAFGTSGALSADTIAELTAAAGVTIDGLLLKDGFVCAADNQGIKLGNTAAAPDIQWLWDGTRLNVTQGTANSEIRYGVDGAGIDQRLYGDTAGVYKLWDQSADADIYADNAKIILGTGLDFTGYHDGTNTLITSITGNVIIDNQAATGATFLDTGTDTNATKVAIRNNTGLELLAVTPTTASGGTVVAYGLRAVSATAAAITTTRTLTAADSGGVFSVAKTSAYAITLPTPSQGMRFKFLIVDTGANAVTFSDGAAHFFGQIQEAGTAPIAMTGTTITAAASQNVGDWLLFEGISATQYLVTGSSIQASKFTIA